MTVQEIQKRIGPTQKDQLIEDGHDSYRSLEYLDGAVCLFFDQDVAWRLASVEVDSASEVRLFGESLFPNNLKQVQAILHQHLAEGVARGVTVDRCEEIEEIAMKIPDLRMTFYFDLHETLQQVSWGLFFDANDDIIWPPDPPESE
jgi:hypothetical protein